MSTTTTASRPGPAAAPQDDLAARVTALEFEAYCGFHRADDLEKRLNSTIEVLNAMTADISKALEAIRG